MAANVGYMAFALAPLLLGAVLVRVDPRCRRVRVRSLLVYCGMMGLLIYGALRLVASISSSRVLWREVLVVLWFTIAWRLAWAIWLRTVGRVGQRWVRWGRMR